MATTAPMTIRGSLILRIGDHDAHLGEITIPVRITGNASGNVTLSADTQEVRNLVQAVYDESERQAGEAR